MKNIVLSVLVATSLYAGGSIQVYETSAQIPCDSFAPYGYVGISGTYGEFDEVVANEELTEDNIGGQLQGGYMIFGQDGWEFGVEGRYGFLTLDYLDVSYLTGYAKVEKDIGKFGLYGLMGYGTTDFSATYDYGLVRVTIDDSVSDFTWGAGIKYAFNNQFDVFIDYSVLPDYEIGTDTIDSDIVSVGVNYKFGGF
jgi:opacity protein-like surface antigen